MGATLADGGVNPLTGERVVDAETLPLHARGDDDRRPLRDLRRLALRHRPARARAASAAASSPSRPARAGSARSRRRSTRPATASRASSPRASCRAGSASTSSPRSRTAMRRLLVALVGRRACSSPPPAASRGRGRDGARRALRAGRAARRRQPRAAAPASRTCRSTSTLLFGEPTVALRGPWDGGDLVKIGPTATDLSKGLYEYHLDFPGNALDPGLRLPALAARLITRADADRLRARRDRAASPRQARAAVLVLLRLQRLEQPARGRLGDDPARLRRVDARRRRCSTRRSRSATASTRAPSARRGTTTSSSASTARIRSCIRPPGRTRTSSARRSTSAARPRRASAATTRAGRPSTSARSCRRSRATRRSARRAFPWIAFEGRWGELQAGVLQRADRAEPEDAVDGADQLVGGLARPQLHRPGRQCVRPGGDRLLLRRRRQGLAGARAASCDRPLEFSLVLGALVLLLVVGLSPRDVAAVRSAPRRAPARVGPDPQRVVRGCTSGACRSSSGSASLLLPISLLVILVQALVLHATSFARRPDGRREQRAGRRSSCSRSARR